MDALPPDGADDLFDMDENGQPQMPMAFVSIQEPIMLRVEEVTDDRTPDGMVCMGAYLNGRLIARSAVPPEIMTDLSERDVFSAAVRLGLAAIERDPGLQCRLFALLPADRFSEEEEPVEPWTESVPRFEDNIPDDPTEEGFVPVLLGHVVRFEKDRKHPNDLAAEAADVMRTIVADEKPLSSIVDKFLEDL